MGKNPFSALRRTSGRSRLKNPRKPPPGPVPESADNLSGLSVLGVTPNDGASATTVVVPAKAKKKTAGARLWMRFDKSGETEVLECDKSAILKRVAIPARDLRILGPVFSHSSNILAREKAMVVNLEFIKAIVTAEEVLLLDPMRQEVLPFVDQLKQQLHNKGGTYPMDGQDTAMHLSGGGKLLPNTDAADELKTDFPFEFQVLEIALEIVCTYLDSSVADLERNAYPILDELARSVSNKNLEHVRSLKSNLTRLLARVQKVRDEIEHLLDDNDDMAQLYLTRKWIQNQEYEAMIANASSNSVVPAIRNLHRFGSNRSGSLVTNTDDNDVEDLEMLLEAYFMQLDGTRNKILSNIDDITHFQSDLLQVREYIDDTEDYVNIQLDHQRNELIQLQLTLTIASFAIAVETLIAGIFGMNIPCQLYHINGVFGPFVAIITIVSIILFFVILGYARWKKLLGS
ncbi:unnamed protein product [Rhodiola kirilowii]